MKKGGFKKKFAGLGAETGSEAEAGAGAGVGPGAGEGAGPGPGARARPLHFVCQVFVLLIT